MSVAASTDLPKWAQVSDKRRAHIMRVTALLEQWADELHVGEEQARTWRDAGLLHDALRDASEKELRKIVGDDEMPVGILHGPAAAITLERKGETRADLLQAVRWHTVGFPGWDTTGRALFMADFLEPGRPFSQADRAFLAAHVRADFDGVFRQVVRNRIEWSLREGKGLYPETIALWNSVR
jgi:2-amino-4-hydroxy-6-hydroxymethyldihydropteridine diphosphokinase